MGRVSYITDTYKTCLYLASDHAKFITGVVLEVDGGRII
ncbi:MAG: SDR family oxidoreductase [Paracoccaceae bacterium]